MSKKNQGRIKVSGVPRKVIDADQMVQIIIALGQEIDARRKSKPRRQAEVGTEAVS